MTGWRERYREIKNEMEKDGLELAEQVVVLTLGGVLGGYAFQVSQANYPFVILLPLLLFVLCLGLVSLAFIHFWVARQRLLTKQKNEGQDEENDGQAT